MEKKLFFFGLFLCVVISISLARSHDSDEYESYEFDSYDSEEYESESYDSRDSHKCCCKRRHHHGKHPCHKKHHHGKPCRHHDDSEGSESEEGPAPSSTPGQRPAPTPGPSPASTPAPATNGPTQAPSQALSQTSSQASSPAPTQAPTQPPTQLLTQSPPPATSTAPNSPQLTTVILLTTQGSSSVCPGGTAGVGPCLMGTCPGDTLSCYNGVICCQSTQPEASTVAPESPSPPTTAIVFPITTPKLPVNDNPLPELTTTSAYKTTKKYIGRKKRFSWIRDHGSEVLNTKRNRIDRF